jgi:PadR family transcriptional regulator, regulatory protein PadR
LHFDKKIARLSPVEAKGDVSIMGDRGLDLPQGTLDLLILKTIAVEAQHGWAIAQRIQLISSDALRVQQGSLYPALHRLERRGWIKARWGASENNRQAKFYELTRAGREQLDAQSDIWRRLTVAVGAILDMG